MEANEQKNAYTGYKFIIAVLAVLLVGVSIWYVRQSRQLSTINTEMTAERDSLSLKLDDMLWEYEAMKTDNANIQLELESEKEKIQMLLQKVRTNEKVHFAEIRKYEREANTLRDIMRSYIKQIDSLNTLSQMLLAENKEVKHDLRTSREENKKLAEEKDNLSSQVERGSMLRVRGVAAEGLNARDKDTKRAGSTKKIRACFTINENSIAKAGVREAYIRILAPNSAQLTNAASGTFSARTEELTFSAKREVDYQNGDLETCIFFDAKDMKLSKGGYTVEVYVDGSLSGTGEFLLK